MYSTFRFVIASALSLTTLLVASCTSVAPSSTAGPQQPSPTRAPLIPTVGLGKPAPPPNPTPVASLQRGKYGGVLKRSIRRDLPHFDLHTHSSSQYLGALSPAYNGLVQYDPFNPGKVIPDLAESWTISSDGLTYNFVLRRGVSWHDGAPLQAADAVLSVERLRKHVHTGAGLVGLDTVQVVGDNGVTIKLKYPAVALMQYMAMAWSVIAPKHIIDKKGHMKDDVVGTGAFRFKRFVSGSFMELEKNPRYFVSERPYLDGLATYFIPDEATSVAALRTGRVDYMITLSDVGAMRVKDTFKEATVGQFRMGRWWASYLPVDRPPWNDIRVRRAVHLAVDRQAAIKVLTNGLGELGSVIPEGIGGIPVEELLKRPGYRQPKDADVAEAKRLLAEAGFPAGFKTSTLYMRGSEGENQSLFFKDQLAKIGIDVDIRTADDAVVYDLRSKRQYETFTHRRPMSVNDADDILMKEYKTDGTDNWANVSDPALQDIIALQSREQDEVKRKALIRQTNEKIEELASTILLLWTGYWRAWAPQVKNYVLGGQLYDDDKFVDVWLER